jgi:hypothetical protein
MKLACQCFWALAACALLLGRAQAGPVLTFEGLKDFEAVANYYNGGTGSMGTGPGPSYGITFGAFALASIPGQSSGTVTPFPGDPSPPTVLLLVDPTSQIGPGNPISTTMNVAGGFTQGLSFYFINIADATRVTDAKFFSGPNGTGTLLATDTLPVTPAAFGGPSTVSFSGTALSVVFDGGNNQLALDDISFITPVPEPSTMALVIASLPLLLILWWRGRNTRANQYFP